MATSTNPQLELAYQYVQYTHQNIFLTGKAGTGKTTFLHRVQAESIKRTAVVAPTGVAAINAKGVTIHSFFQLPFGPYVPGAKTEANKQRKFTKKKRNIIKSLDLLIIDEISMVRADLLDGIDDVLRRFKDRNRPFGGVQLLMIGDLHQLPPVVKQEDWYLLRDHYNTAYFFGSKALQLTKPITIQLKHIYRQSDDVFINLLNKVRDNQMTEDVLKTLNSRYIDNFLPKDEAGYITLTSHNAAAQKINEERLTALKKRSYKFTATIDGDFPVHSYPTEEILEFKVGAQVLFIKNDTSHEKRYYNGKIGQIQAIDTKEKTISIKCPEETTLIHVSPVDWNNIKYKLDEETKELNEETVGTFTQFPLKLAWAITIHKSQGLTFERAIIDAEAAFAHGQVYVALSRCKSFEGIVLRSKISTSSVRTDMIVKNYSEEAERNEPTDKELQQSKQAFQQDLIRELFDFKESDWALKSVLRTFMEYENTLTTSALELLRQWAAKAEKEVFQIGQKFQPSLHNYFIQSIKIEENQALQDRIKKASIYFSNKISNELLPELKNIPVLTDNQAVKKSAIENIERLQKTLFIKKNCFLTVQKGFNAQQYLQAKANADIDFDKRKPMATSARSQRIPADVAHPALYAQLATWREARATEMDKEPYSIITRKTMSNLTEFLPTNSKMLLKIKGIGKIKAQQFGEEIIDIIEEYCQEKGLSTNLMPIAPKLTKPPKGNTKTISYDLFKSGKTISEIAADRGLTTSTIEGHLAHFVALGELDIFTLIDNAKVHEIAAFYVEKDTTELTDAYKYFDSRYSYAQLRMVLKHLQAKQIVE